MNKTIVVNGAPCKEQPCCLVVACVRKINVPLLNAVAYATDPHYLGTPHTSVHDKQGDGFGCNLAVNASWMLPPSPSKPAVTVIVNVGAIVGSLVTLAVVIGSAVWVCRTKQTCCFNKPKHTAASTVVINPATIVVA